VTYSPLTRSGNLVFPPNLVYQRDPSGTGVRAVRLPTGHQVFYSPEGLRILATDPEGHPLHECEWQRDPDGQTVMSRARFRLDWNQWVGVKPQGLVNSTVLDLSRKPGWERLRADDLRQLAARAMNVPLDEVRFFYGDDDLVVRPNGQAIIRHKKDALYVLEDGTFDRARFMSCMGALHWHRIDFLPVVELFQSLLPGTGSAAFELIRGLYDDQNADAPKPLPLRYRGMPTYPSDAAFRLFSAFFTPHGPGGAPAFPVFMDVSQSHTVTWLPAAEPPRRYFGAGGRFCMTVTDDVVRKVTCSNDSTGLSYVHVPPGRLAPCQRTVAVEGAVLLLRDESQERRLPLDTAAFAFLRDAPVPEPAAVPMTWRDFFAGSAPEVSPRDAFGAVLLYPDDETVIDDLASQPFVADYLHDVLGDPKRASAVAAQAKRILIDGFDACFHTLLDIDRAREQIVLYEHPAFAQKQAQALWNRLAQANRFDAGRTIRLLASQQARKAAYESTYDLIYRVIAFPQTQNPAGMSLVAAELHRGLTPGGHAFVVGPPSFARICAPRLQVMERHSVEALPTFQMHRGILPKARLRPDLTLYRLARR
jgi:hypothetical protein